MGQAKSTNNSQIINSTVQQVINKTIQNCSGPINQQQIISIKNSKNVFISDVTMNQYASINMNCASTAISSTDFSSSMKNALTQTAESQAAALNVNSSVSSNVSKTINELTQTIQNTMSQSCIQSILQQQALIVDSSQNAVIQNVTFNQNATAYVQCLQKNDSYNTLVSNLSTSLEQASTSKTEGLFTIGLSGSCGSTFSSVFLIVCCILLMVGIPAIMKMFGGKGSGTSGSTSSTSGSKLGKTSGSGKTSNWFKGFKGFKGVSGVKGAK
jgi:hypothetical protein